MVHGKTNKRKAINKARIVFSLLSIVTIALACAVLVAVRNNNSSNDGIDAEEIINPETEPEENTPTPEISEINFQPTIDNWANATSGKKGIVIYDLDLDKIVGEYNSNEKFQTASLYKLFVVYEGYRRLQNGTLTSNEPAGSTGYTILECLDLVIRESYSPCAEALWAIIGHDELNEIARNDFGIPDVIVSNLTATPLEITQIMNIFYEHDEILNPTLIFRMKDSFLNQPATSYNWRQGLPSGFSNKVNVYNKVGWNYDGKKWTIYDDAAIIDFINEDRHFIIVVMTSGIDYREIRKLSTQIEETFYNQYVLKN